MFFLMSKSLKAAQQRKYFTYFCAVELNPLAMIGVRSAILGQVKFAVFGLSMDMPGYVTSTSTTIMSTSSTTTTTATSSSCTFTSHLTPSQLGKDQFLELQGHSAAFGCADCTIKFDSRWKIMYTGSRMFLPADSPLRQHRCGQFEFPAAEHRPAPLPRTTSLLFDSLEKMENEGLSHFLGFKGPGMLSTRVGYDYRLDKLPEIMHLMGRLYVNY